MFDSDMSSFIQQHIKRTFFFSGATCSPPPVISSQLSVYDIMAGNRASPRGNKRGAATRLTTDMMGMDTPKMDGSVEPNSWLEERAETQCDGTQPNEERHDETVSPHGDYITKGGSGGCVCVSSRCFLAHVVSHHD